MRSEGSLRNWSKCFKIQRCEIENQSKILVQFTQQCGKIRKTKNSKIIARTRKQKRNTREQVRIFVCLCRYPSVSINNSK